MPDLRPPIQESIRVPMSDLTYQNNETTVPLETYEWDRTWWEHTENKTAKRVFYLGDSISWGIRPEMQAMVKTEFLVDALATSKAPDNPYLLPTLDLVLQQTNSVDIILVNSGLHGWHLQDDTEYPTLLRALLTQLKEHCPSVAVLLTTCVENKERNARVIARNKSASKVAMELGCPIVDLYTPSLQCIHTDGVHLNREGYQTLATVIVEALRPLLK